MKMDEITHPIPAIWSFEIFQNARSVGRWSVGVGRRSVLNYTLFSYTHLHCVRNVAREEYKMLFLDPEHTHTHIPNENSISAIHSVHLAEIITLAGIS